MQFFPYTSAQFLDDAVFLFYGGMTGTSSQAQRNAAYAMSERTMSEYLETFLKPTIVTGTYSFGIDNRWIELDHTYVERIDIVRLWDETETNYHTISGTANREISLLDADRGLLDVHWLRRYANFSSPYKIQVVYQAGFPTGTTMTNNMMMALVTAADLFLGEILGYGNEVPGIVGVQKFSDQRYSETRVPVVRTPFGTSPRSEFIARLVSHFVNRRYVGL